MQALMIENGILIKAETPAELDIITAFNTDPQAGTELVVYTNEEAPGALFMTLEGVEDA